MMPQMHGSNSSKRFQEAHRSSKGARAMSIDLAPATAEYGSDSDAAAPGVHMHCGVYRSALAAPVLYPELISLARPLTSTFDRL
jgi:hypothetical protein